MVCKIEDKSGLGPCEKILCQDTKECSAWVSAK